MTYPAICWLERTLKDSDVVFEFGGGNSTLWLAPRVAAVVTVEHDDRWVRTLRDLAPDNVRLIHRRADDPAAYAFAPSEDIQEVDLVIVDGIHRMECFQSAMELVGDTLGAIVLDDSDRPRYASCHESAEEAGFLRIDYFGPRPGQGGLSTTSVFTRNPWRWHPGEKLPMPSGY
jgi:hypothetical protein